ncbi:MAG TPA: hypothetical protein VJV23_00480 [Candidatus Polarisedimenticolia bacterium]|nr:hypothetical protein [Candidatus Polarisedimenticolia bacterium]
MRRAAIVLALWPAALAAIAAASALAAARPVLTAAEQDARPTPPAAGTDGASPTGRRRVAVPEEDPNFIALLDRLAERAALYKRQALGFTCREVVISAKYDIDSGNFKKSDRTIFDYLFEERTGGALREVREELVPDGEGFKRRGTDFEPPLPPAYAWATLFARENRPRFHFRPAGQVVKAYRLLTMIQFIGTAPNPGGDDIAGWSGQVAVEGKTLNLWTIQAEPSGQPVRLEVEVLKYRRAFAIAGVPLAQRPHGWQLEVLFGFETNGLSFPTEQSLSMTSLARSQRMALEEKQTFRYEDYRFFSIETGEEVKEERPPEP